MAMHVTNSAEMAPYTALRWGEFVANPHLLYSLCRSSPNGDGADDVINMTGAWTNPNNSEFKVENMEELQRVRNELLTKPILFHIKVEHNKTEHYVVMKVRKVWRDEFAVLVNTRHPTIREVLSQKLNEVTQHMQEGKKFCLKLNFGPPVKQWYSGVVDAEVSLCDSRRNSESGHMEIAVHNYSTPVECCVNPVCIVCCFPFWFLFGGPCYMVHRTMKCIDDSHRFTDLPVQLITGMNVTVRVQSHPQQPYPQPRPAVPQGPPGYSPYQDPGGQPPPPYPGSY
ncbi:uncharacterized protein LOC111130756 [Crassostrea virginica]